MLTLLRIMFMMALAFCLDCISTKGVGARRLDWHNAVSFPQLEGFRIYDDKLNSQTKHIDILVNNRNIKLEFTLGEMQDQNARTVKAEQFVEEHLAPLMEFGMHVEGLVEDNEGTRYKASSSKYLSKHHTQELIDQVAKKILEKVEDYVHTYSHGSIAIKKRWAHGINLVYHRGAATLAPAIERMGEWEELGVQMM